MSGDAWSDYRKVLERAVRDQIEETDFNVWVGKAAERGGLAVRARRDGAKVRQTIESIVADASGRPLLITAEAGAGKSTMVLQLLLETIGAERPPVLVQLGSWNGSGEPLRMAVGATEALLDSVAHGGHLVVLDGIDEVRAESLDEPCEAIVELCRTVGGNQYVVTGRAGEIPRWFPAQFRTAEVLPLDPAEVEQHLRPLLDSSSRALSTDVRARLLDLSRNPLILAMTMRVLADDADTEDLDEEDIASFRSVSSLYQHFLRRIEERDEVKRKSGPAGLGADERRALLRRLAWKMAYNNSVFEERDLLADWLLEPDDLDETPAAGQASAGLSTVLGRPPLKQISLGGAGNRHGFLHATFRDVYAGEYLLRGAPSGARPYAIADVILPDGRAGLWPAIVHMAGLAPSPSVVADEVIKTAVDFRRQDLFVLASECIATRWDSPHQSVDDLCLRLLDAFKNWGEAFDFSLIRAANGLLARTSSFFPDRLRADLRYFLGKYAPRVPIALPTRRISALKEQILSASSQEACNAAFTLLQRFNPFDAEGVADILDALVAGTGSASPDVRQESLAALQAISRMDSRAAMLARSTFLNFSGADTQPMERVYALQGLAKCGEPVDFDVIESALFDRSNPFRDSASWALQRLVHAAGSDQALVDRALDVYARALSRETTDSEGSYAAGNIVYSIGVLEGTRLRGQVEDLVRHSPSEYVLEDAVNCLGLLGRPESIAVIAPLTTHADPAVRMKAGEALGRIGGTDAEQAVTAALTAEHNEVVRDAFSAALVEIAETSATGSAPVGPSVDWAAVRRLINRAEQRNANSVRVAGVNDEELDLLRLAIETAVGSPNPDDELNARGAGDRREVVVLNSTLHKLSDEAHSHGE